MYIFIIDYIKFNQIKLRKNFGIIFANVFQIGTKNDIGNYIIFYFIGNYSTFSIK